MDANREIAKLKNVEFKKNLMGPQSKTLYKTITGIVPALKLASFATTVNLIYSANCL